MVGRREKETTDKKTNYRTCPFLEKGGFYLAG